MKEEEQSWMRYLCEQTGTDPDKVQASVLSCRLGSRGGTHQAWQQAFSISLSQEQRLMDDVNVWKCHGKESPPSYRLTLKLRLERRLSDWEHLLLVQQPQVQFQHPQSRLQLSVTPVPGAPIAVLAPVGTRCAGDTHAYMQEKPSNSYKWINL